MSLFLSIIRLPSGLKVSFWESFRVAQTIVRDHPYYSNHIISYLLHMVLLGLCSESPLGLIETTQTSGEDHTSSLQLDLIGTSPQVELSLFWLWLFAILRARVLNSIAMALVFGNGKWIFKQKAGLAPLGSFDSRGHLEFSNQ
jgi:hypothetical protein